MLVDELAGEGLLAEELEAGLVGAMAAPPRGGGGLQWLVLWWGRLQIVHSYGTTARVACVEAYTKLL